MTRLIFASKVVLSELSDELNVMMPKGAKIISVVAQRDKMPFSNNEEDYLVIYFVSKVTRDMVRRRLRVARIGQRVSATEFDPVAQWIFVGSVYFQKAELTLHVWDQGEM